MRLLVADRSPAFADLLAHTLRVAGPAEVYKATDSEVVWRYLSRGYAQAAILDLALGPRNASELVVALRRLPAPHAHIPVIGMTPVIRRDEFNAATRAGINLVVTKPVSADTILSRLARLLAERVQDRDAGLVEI
jgi:CheY-like chemotaxis protein